MIGGIRGGTSEFVEGGRSTVIGESSGALHATVTLHSARFWRRMLRGSTGLADGYVRGEWDCDDLVALATIVGSNMSRMDTMRRRFQFIIGPLQRLGLMMPRNTRTRGRKQISAHYDLGNELFSTFLDSSMNYSAACFDDPEQDLESAQVNKMNRIADQLDAGPETHVLEIGTGWGGLAIHLVEMTGCRVSTTTISREQAALAHDDPGHAVGCRHAEYDLDRLPVVITAITAQGESTALEVSLCIEYRLDKIFQIMGFLENTDLFPQSGGTGTLIREGLGLDLFNAHEMASGAVILVKNTNSNTGRHRMRVPSILGGVTSQATTKCVNYFRLYI